LNGIHKGQLALFNEKQLDERSAKIKQLRVAAEKGNVEAMYELGEQFCRYWQTCPDTGVFAPIDRVEGAKWYRKAAEQGHAMAQLHLGILYTEGIPGTPEDKIEEYRIEGVKWLRKAVEQGVGLTELGMCYFNGTGVPEDKEEAVKWFRKATERGEPNGLWMLADCYFHGYGVPEDKAESARLYRTAAEQGDSIAQYQLGRCYYYGDGVPQNKAEAIKRYKESTFFLAWGELASCYARGEYIPDDEEVEGLLNALRWMVESVNEWRITEEYEEYWQERAREAAELLREIEARKSGAS